MYMSRRKSTLAISFALFCSFALVATGCGGLQNLADKVKSGLSKDRDGKDLSGGRGEPRRGPQGEGHERDGSPEAQGEGSGGPGSQPSGESKPHHKGDHRKGDGDKPRGKGGKKGKDGKKMPPPQVDSQCIKTQCAEEIDACNEDTTCEKSLGCLMSCSGDKCDMECVKAAKEKLHSVVECSREASCIKKPERPESPNKTEGNENP